MSFAYLPLYTGDYLRDTQHLSLLEHGAYLKLLMHCWDQKGPAPIDERKLMGICNARSKEELSAVYLVLEEFFIRMEDGWYNRRMQLEIERCEAISNKRSSAGKMGYEAKAKQMPSKCLTSAKQVPLSPSPSPSLSPNQKETPSVSHDKIVFDGSSFKNLNSHIQVWKTAYPAIDVEIEINKAAAWLVANPKNKKSQYSRFLNGWLSRAQDRAPRVEIGGLGFDISAIKD